MCHTEKKVHQLEVALCSSGEPGVEENLSKSVLNIITSGFILAFCLKPSLTRYPLIILGCKDQHKDLALEYCIYCICILNKQAIEIVRMQSHGYYSHLFLVQKPGLDNKSRQVRADSNSSVLFCGIQIPSKLSPCKAHSGEVANTTGINPQDKQQVCSDCKTCVVAHWDQLQKWSQKVTFT